MKDIKDYFISILNETTKFLGNVKLSLTEQYRWSFNDLTIEEK